MKVQYGRHRSFNPVRQEIGRLAMEKLLADGRNTFAD